MTTPFLCRLFQKNEMALAFSIHFCAEGKCATGFALKVVKFDHFTVRAVIICAVTGDTTKAQRDCLPQYFYTSMSSIYTRNPNPFPIGIKFGFLNLGGGRWIRTTEGIASRFTVCPLWPLGNSPIFNCSPPPGARDGAGRRTRTPDLLITNQLLYQLSYTSQSSQPLNYTIKPGACQRQNATRRKKSPPTPSLRRSIGRPRGGIGCKSATEGGIL